MKIKIYAEIPKGCASCEEKLNAAIRRATSLGNEVDEIINRGDKPAEWNGAFKSLAANIADESLENGDSPRIDATKPFVMLENGYVIFLTDFVIYCRTHTKITQ